MKKQIGIYFLTAILCTCCFAQQIAHAQAGEENENSIFVILGSVTDLNGAKATGDLFVAVTNETRSLRQVAQGGIDAPEGSYVISFVALGETPVVAVGDVFKVSVQRLRGPILGEVSHVVTQEEARHARAVIDIQFQEPTTPQEPETPTDEGVNPIFIVLGNITDASGAEAAATLRVTVTNETKSLTQETQIGVDVPAGSYMVSFVALGETPVVAVGDVFKVSVQTPTGESVGETSHVVTQEEVRRAKAVIDVQVTEVIALLRIDAVSPNPVPGSNQRQWVTIQGTGFTPESRVTLRTGNETFDIPVDRTQFVSNQEVQVFVNVTMEEADWTAQVINPGNRASNLFPFRVELLFDVNPTLSITPPTGTVEVTTMKLQGSGFTPNGTATSTTELPDGTVQHFKRNIDGTGHFSVTFVLDQVGTYTNYETDDTTGSRSNTISYIGVSKPEGPIHLAAPWDKGQYWVTQTYDKHTFGWNKSVDFYYADPQSPGTYGESAESGRAKNVRAAHDGIAQTREETFDCPSQEKEITQTNFTIISMDGTLKTEYIHLRINPDIIGQQVKAGDTIGWVSDEGCAALPHLMLIVYRNGEAVALDDPGGVLLDGEVIFSGIPQSWDGGPGLGTVYRYSAVPRGVTKEEITDEFLNEVFEEAAGTYNIPSNLLRAIAYEESKWDQAARSADGGIGIMQLTDEAVWSEAERLTGNNRELMTQVTPEGARANIIGAAAVLGDMFDNPAPPKWVKSGTPLVSPGDPRDALETWWWIVVRYNGAGADGRLETTNYPFRVYHWIRNGVPTKVQEIDISFPPDVTSREATPAEKAKFEVRNSDADLFPLAPLGHIRITPDFLALDLVLHGNDGSVIHTPESPPITGFPAWDVNQDGVVNIFDMVLVGQHLGESPPKDSRADVNKDGVVNIFDFVLVGQHLGETYIAAASSVWAIDDSQHLPALQRIYEFVATHPNSSEDILELKLLLRRLIGLVENQIVPSESALGQNYPNPFNPETWIPYQISEASEVTITIYDALGRAVKQLDLGYQHSGIYRTKARAAYWDGRNEAGESVASGTYFVELKTDKYRQIRRIVLLK